MSEPRTEAGKRLAKEFFDGVFPDPAYIVAIEDEARLIGQATPSSRRRTRMAEPMRELLMTARRWVMWLDEPTLAQRQAWLDEVEVALNPPRTPCPICPHWMEVHNPDGTCGCGAHG